MNSSAEVLTERAYVVDDGGLEACSTQAVSLRALRKAEPEVKQSGVEESWRTQSQRQGQKRTVQASKALLSAIFGKYRDSVGCDLTILAGKHGSLWREFHVHKVVLAARCSSMREELEAEVRRGNWGHIHWTWEGVAPVIAGRVIDFLYTGRVSIGDSDVIDLLDVSLKLGVDPLVDIARNHVRSQLGLGVRNCVDYLKKAARCPHLGLETDVMEFLRSNAHEVVKTPQFKTLSPELLEKVLRMDELSCSEEEIWEALVEWAMWRNGIRFRKGKITHHVHRDAVYQTLAPFLSPGLVRIFDLDPHLFANEVEAAGVLLPSEVMEKYRYDVIMGFSDIGELCKPRMYIQQRIRRRVIVIESTHPHPTGALHSHPNRKNGLVEMPKWVREVEVTFDERTSLGNYSDLRIYLDEAHKDIIFSFYREQKMRELYHVTEPIKLLIPQRRFWFSFYSPAHFQAGWGYRMTCTIARSDFDVEEDAMERLALRDFYDDGDIEPTSQPGTSSR